MADKAVAWLGSALADLRGFPADARRDAGFELRRVQQGLDPDDWNRCRRSAPASARSAFTRAWNTASSTVATFAEAVYVLHAFEKRTRKTPKHDLQLAQERLRALVNRRRTDAGKE